MDCSTYSAYRESEIEKRIRSLDIKRAVADFFKDPDVQRRFEEWQNERDHEKRD